VSQSNFDSAVRKSQSMLSNVAQESASPQGTHSLARESGIAH
jgi:hypothetical protein